MTFFYDLNKRLADIATADTSSTLKEDVATEGSTGDYSAKKARAGKDIGKPGKTFAKIAKSAGERYGSKERGEKVAGAVLAKLRAKESMHERPNEGNEFSGELAKAKATGAKEFKVDGKTYPVKESELEEGYVDFMDKKQMYAKIGAEVEGKADDYTVTFRDGSRKRYQELDGRRRVTTLEPVDAPEETDDEGNVVKRGRGRPKGSKRSLGAKGPSGRSKLMRMEEDYDKDEYDEEGEMAMSQARTIEDAAEELQSILDADENLPEWVQKKISLAKEYIDSARDYLKANRPEQDMDESALQAYLGKKKYGETGMKALQKAGREGASKEKMAKIRAQHDKLDEVEIDEKAVSKAQRAAAGIAYAAKKGDIPKSELRGASKEMSKMPSGELKKFAKTKEKGLPEKKDEAVEETTVAGSVAVSDEAPKSKKGGMTFGKGIYDSMNRELEAMIAESMSVNMSNSTEGGRSITITATDDDAMKLAAILKMAGLGSTGPEDTSSCGTMEEDYGDVTPTQNRPDYPTDAEKSDDALQYAGGLNKPKTMPNPNADRVFNPFAAKDMGTKTLNLESEHDDLDRMREMAGIREAAKPDFPDIDDDGDRKEPIAKAARDKEEKVDEGILAQADALWKEYKAG